MLSRSSILGLVAMGLLAFGCNKSNDQGATPGTPAATSNPASPAPDPASQDAKVVVTRFFEAIRKGDNDTATQLLTTAARKKAEESGRRVAPEAADTARIEVEEAEYPTPEHDIAHVPSKWIDLDETGRPRTDKITWVCRRKPVGWRVGGLAAYVFEGEPPVLLNFEEPEKVAEKQKQLKEEIERRAKQEAAPSAAQATPFQAETKPRDAFRR